MTSTQTECVGIILAGGVSKRMSHFATPKQFLTLGNKPVIAHSMETFDKHPQITSLLIVIRDSERESQRDIFDRYRTKKPLFFVSAGETRQESSYKALSFLKTKQMAVSLVSIHDAARPFLTQKLLSQTLLFAKKYGAAHPILPIRDSLIKRDEKTVSEFDRTHLFAVQTPQSFRFNLIWKAHRNNLNKNATDDSSLIRRIQEKVHLFPGDFFNFKITDKRDYKDAQEIFKNLGKKRRED